MNCVAVDLGGTFLRCGIVSDSDELVVQERIRLDDRPATRADDIWAVVAETIARFVFDHEAALTSDAPIAIAFPGPVFQNRASGQAPTIVGDRPVPDLAENVRALTDRDVVMLNDVSAAAWYFEGRIRADRFAVVTVSSGIGCKLFDRTGAGVMDDRPYAGEIGHLVVDPSDDALVCDCGGSGHLGAISSGRGFERYARRAARRDERGFAASACAQIFGATNASLSNEAHLVPAIVAGDPWASAVLAASIEPLARILGILTIGCGLTSVVIMGGFAQRLGHFYESALTKALGTISDCGAAHVRLDHFVTVAQADEEPGLIGAARYARRRTPVPR